LPTFGVQQLVDRTQRDVAALAQGADLTPDQLRDFVYGAQINAGMTPDEVTEMIVSRPELIAGTPVFVEDVQYVGFGRDPELLRGARGQSDRCGSNPGEVPEVCAAAEEVLFTTDRYSPSRTVCARPSRVCARYQEAATASDISDLPEAELLGSAETNVASYASSTFTGGTACDYSHDVKYTRNVLRVKLAYSLTSVYFCYRDPFEVTSADLYREEAEPTVAGSLVGWDYDRRLFADNSCYQWYAGYDCSGRRVFRTYKFRRCLAPFDIGCIQSSYHRHRHYLHANGASYTDRDR